MNHHPSISFRAAGLLACLFFFSFAAGQDQYVKKYKPLADSLSKTYQIPVKVILAVAIIESGSGTSRNARLMNNHFGIKGKNSLLRTHGIKSAYKQYPSVYDSYLDFVNLLSRRKYYARLKGNPSEEAWFDAMSKAGYSVRPAEWKQLMINAAKRIRL